MKPLVVQNQVRLGPLQCLALSVTGMSYRLFRSVVTVAILGLAVAFLMHMLGYGLIAHETRLLAQTELQDSRLLGEWMARLTQPDPVDQMLAVFSGVAGGELGRRREYESWGALTPDEWRAAEQTARQLMMVQSYLEELPVASRVTLTGGTETAGVWPWVQSLERPERRAAWAHRLDELNLEWPLGNAWAFEELATATAPQLAALMRRIQEGQRRAIQSVRAHFENRDWRMLLAEPPLELGAVLEDAGFRVEPVVLAKLAVQANQLRDLERFNQLLANPAIRTALARRLDLRPDRLTFLEVRNWLVSGERGRELAALCRQHEPEAALSAERLVTLAALARRQAQLQQVVGAETAALETTALSPRFRWLIGVSFLVCLVGVANAMLMSVTERFVEIATLKCLGALDGFVIQVFLFEALVQGAVGGAVGVVSGLALAVVRAWSEFGRVIFSALPAGPLIESAAAAWAVGLLLAGLAAIGPVWVAARLTPMEAMRVE